MLKENNFFSFAFSWFHFQFIIFCYKPRSFYGGGRGGEGGTLHNRWRLLVTSGCKKQLFQKCTSNNLLFHVVHSRFSFKTPSQFQFQFLHCWSTVEGWMLECYQKQFHIVNFTAPPPLYYTPWANDHQSINFYSIFNLHHHWIMSSVSPRSHEKISTLMFCEFLFFSQVIRPQINDLIINKWFNKWFFISCIQILHWLFSQRKY